SPEQIRCEPVDRQTDVYSTAATLYYLLAGRAPFEGGDPAAVVARIASDPVPPLRRLRPEVPRGLDRAVRRGLERDRERRWRSLGEFRAALLPFAPGRLSIGGVGGRFVAYLIDHVLITGAAALTNLLLLWTLGHLAQPSGPARGEPPGPYALVGLVLWLAYFGTLEGVWGCSLGKRLLRLRVWGAARSDPPGVPRALARGLAFYVLISLGSLLAIAVFHAAGA